MKHPIQEMLLNLHAAGTPIENMGLRALGKITGVMHPQIIKYHYDKLVAEKLLPARKRATVSSKAVDMHQELVRAKAENTAIKRTLEVIAKIYPQVAPIIETLHPELAVKPNRAEIKD